jgi:hypothetical protein
MTTTPRTLPQPPIRRQQRQGDAPSGVSLPSQPDEGDVMIDALIGALLTNMPEPHTTVTPSITRSIHDPSMTGIAPSTYRGKYYTPVIEKFRLCVINRESHAHYFSRNSSGHEGAYQFHGKEWRRGLAYMMLPELTTDYGNSTARNITTTLRDTPIYRWSRDMQDRAFFTVASWRGTYSGTHHWFLAGSRCNHLGGIK